MSSGASVISLSDVVLSACCALTILIAFIKRIRLDKHFFTFTYIYICLAFFYLMQFGWVNVNASSRLFVKILFVYLTIKLCGIKFMDLVADVITKLALISLPLFTIQLVSPELMMSMNNLSELVIPQVFKGAGVDYSNSIVFTVNPWGMDRNSGFMWEPGAFAAMCSLALFLRFIGHGYRLDWRVLVLTLALLSAQSTTGALLLIVLGLMWFMNQRTRTIVVFAPMFVLIVACAIAYGPGLEKVQDRLSNWDKTIENQDSYADDRDGISVGRFGSFVLDWNDVLKYPLIGYGLQETERTTGRYVHLVRANGFSDYMARFGFLGVLLLFWNLGRSFYRYGRKNGSRGIWAGVLLVSILSFSNPLLMAPLFLGLQFFYLATEKQLSQDAALSPA